MLRSSRSVVVVSFASFAISACGGSAREKPKATGGTAGMARAGADAIGAGGDSGSARAGRGSAPAAGTAGMLASGGIGGAGGAEVGPSLGGMAASGGASTAVGGNLASGGAPNGGATTLPAAGSPQMPGLMDPPPNCESKSQSGDSEHCDYEFSCAGQPHFTNCSLETDTRWGCDCGTFSDPTKYFEIEGVQGLDACGKIAHACMTEANAVGAVTCEPRERTTDSSACAARDTCGTALDLGPGITARAVDPYRVKCGSTVSALFATGTAYTCSCLGGPLNNKTYLVAGPSVDQVCGPVVDFCTVGRPPDTSQPEKCADESTMTSTDSDCNELQLCGWPVDLGNGVSLTTTKERSLACEQQNGMWQCSCIIDSNTLKYAKNLNAKGLAACNALLPACQPDAMFQSTGQATCTTSYQSADTLYCTTDLSCSQAVTSNGLAITGYGWLTVSCSHNDSSTPWDCTCSTTKDSSSFSLDAALSATQTCANATTRCQSEVTPVNGVPGPL